ncbi:MAG: ethylbenzene dehydrogenase-related protein [Halodesulfurarchaeum sp.]
MTERRQIAAVGVLVLLLIVSSAAVPRIVAGRPANQVNVAHLPGSRDSLARPTGQAWENVEPSVVPLTSAPSGLPNAQDTVTDSVRVAAATTGSRLYVRMHWRDGTKNASPASLRDFTDAAAIEVPLQPGTQPAIAMGSVQTPVNVWYWNAAEGPGELVAGGAGSTTRMQTTIETEAVRRNGGWTVVFHRSLHSSLENHRSFSLDRDVRVAFAVWNGANQERAGRKAASAWMTFPFGPAETGPTYQYLLWAIAGIALAVAVLLSIVAVRRRES